MRVHLERDLERLHQKILSMCALAEEVIHGAVKILSAGDFALEAKVVDHERQVDAYDIDIEDECLKMIALHQPVAADLRRIAATLKIAGEIERVSDFGVNLTERARGLAEGPGVAVPPKLLEMAQIALGMLHRAIDAFVQGDSQLARRVCEEDDLVDRLNVEIIDELTARMESAADKIRPCMHLFSAARYLERVADHATNIAEDVVYMQEGVFIRHGAKP